MENDNIVWKIEKDLWLQGIELFEKHLARECLMAFPMPTGILLNSEILAQLKTAPRWDSVEITNQKTIHNESDITVIGYEAHAIRDKESYGAICSSSYIHVDQKWYLFQHQQTPFS